MKEESLNENNKLIQTGNSGEAYYGKDAVNTGDQNVLGTVDCKLCGKQRPFERVRWSDKAKAYVCLDCLEKSE